MSKQYGVDDYEMLCSIIRMLCANAQYGQTNSLFKAVAPLPCTHPAHVLHGAMYSAEMVTGQVLYIKPVYKLSKYSSGEEVSLRFFATSTNHDKAMHILRTCCADSVYWFKDSNIALENPVDKNL